MEIKLTGNNVFEGENNARTLSITVDEAYADYEIRLAFMTPAGCRCITPEIEINECEAQYFLPQALLDAPGRLLAQIVAENEDQRIVKSEVYEFDVEKSVVADSFVDDDGELITLWGVKDSLDALFEELENYALKSDIPTKTSELINDSGYLTEHQDISGKQDVLNFDDTPTKNSINPVTSGGVYDAIANIGPDHFIKTSLAEGSHTMLEGFLQTDELKEGMQIVVVTPGVETSPNRLRLISQPSDGWMFDRVFPIYSFGNTQADLTFPPYSLIRLTYLTGIEEGNMRGVDGWCLDADQHQIYDASPTFGSRNPVTSDGIYSAIENLTGGLNFKRAYNAKPFRVKDGDIFYDSENNEWSIFSMASGWGEYIPDENTLYIVVAPDTDLEVYG